MCEGVVRGRVIPPSPPKKNRKGKGVYPLPPRHLRGPQREHQEPVHLPWLYAGFDSRLRPRAWGARAATKQTWVGG